MPYALIQKSTNTLVAFVETTDGYDMADFIAVAIPSGQATDWAWNGSSLVARAPTPSEVTALSLANDPRWLAMQKATPDQIDAYLDANVTDLASARRMFKILILATQIIVRSR